MRVTLLAALLALGVSPAATGQDGDLAQAPHRVAPAECGVGRRIPDLPGTDVEGKSLTLGSVASARPIVLALVSSSCPVGRKIGPALGELEKTWSARGVAFLYIAPIGSDSDPDLSNQAKEQGLSGRIVRDRDLAWSRALGADTTTDAFLLDAARTLVYRGAVNDQCGVGYAREHARRNYLSDAIEALLSGRVPPIQATWAPGCTLDVTKSRPPAEPVTYHNRISRIVQKACLDCHRKGGVAPFALGTPAEVAAHKGMIRTVVERGTMPPWFAAPVPEGEASPWANDRSLSKGEKDDLLGWLAGGLPEGDPADAPLARKFPESWAIGTPDAIFRLPRVVRVPATGTMPYVDLETETNFPEDRWVTGLEVRPTARDVVHHVLVFATEGQKAGENPGEAIKRRFSEFAGFFAVYVPGLSTLVYPDGYAKPLPRGAKLRFQLHYTPSGVAREDRTELGLVFAKSPPRKVVRTIGISNVSLRIPPGAENYESKGSIPVLFDVELLSFFPHMHLRGKAFRYELTLPGAKHEVLLDVPRYDFNWQLSYFLAEPRRVPKGSRVDVRGWFDNSAGNPANPDPTRTVPWGPQTTDEMLLGYVDYVNLAETPRTSGK